MEKLKSIDEITEPDKRNKNTVWTDDEGNLVLMELKYLHRDATKISLHESVPDAIKDHFSQSLNLLIYSWFNYQFNVTASFMSFVTLEYSLKVKLKPKGRKSFSELLKEANAKKLISLDDEEINSIPKLRNEYAHGSSMLHNQSIPHIELCAKIINQLFSNDTE